MESSSFHRTGNFNRSPDNSRQLCFDCDSTRLLPFICFTRGSFVWPLFHCAQLPMFTYNRSATIHAGVKTLNSQISSRGKQKQVIKTPMVVSPLDSWKLLITHQSWFDDQKVHRAYNRSRGTIPGRRRVNDSLIKEEEASSKMRVCADRKPSGIIKAFVYSTCTEIHSRHDSHIYSICLSVIFWYGKSPGAYINEIYVVPYLLAGSHYIFQV